MVAAHLKEKGYIKEIKDAFRTILSENGGYYTPPRRVTSIEAIEFLSSVGAVSVLAHPYLTFENEEAEEFLRMAVGHGLTAMETRYSTYSEEINAIASSAAKKYGLLESGGSDDHGDNKPHIRLGTGMVNLSVPYEFYEKMRDFACTLHERRERYMEYVQMKKDAMKGFQTWNVRSVLSHVHMPVGFAVNVAFKEYSCGHYLKETLIGRFDGENYQIGFVDVCDRVYPKLVEAARAMGERMYGIRYQGGAG